MINIVLLAVALLFYSRVNAQTYTLEQLAKEAERTHSEAVLVFRDNRIALEKYFHKGSPTKRTETMSATKSIVSLGIGKLVDEGKLHLDSAVSTFYPEWNQGRKRNITIRMLLNHTSGLQNVPNADAEIGVSSDFIQLALCAELATEPGKVFSYNNKAANLLSGIIEKASGKRMDKYIGESFFAPLGIEDFYWKTDSDNPALKNSKTSGKPYAMAGCELRPKDFLKIGQLILNRGKWNGKQLISEAYLNECLAPTELYKGCGLLWWLVYDKTVSVIDAQIIDDMKRNEIVREFIQKAESIVGRYETESQFDAAVEKAFGKNAWAQIAETLNGKGLKLRRREYGNIIGYKADGFLGNYIIVIPAKNLVAVRTNSWDSFENNETDNFFDFENYIVNLK